MASALKRGCRFIAILFALLLAVAVGAGLWLWQGHRGFADAPIGGSHRGELVLVDRVFDTASQTFAVRARIANPLKRQGICPGCRPTADCTPAPGAPL